MNLASTASLELLRELGLEASAAADVLAKAAMLQGSGPMRRGNTISARQVHDWLTDCCMWLSRAAVCCAFAAAKAYGYDQCVCV